MHPNVKAFLDTIAFSEGTSRIPNSDNGYRAIVGGNTFDSYGDHPRQLITISKYNLKSTAAGRYQLLVRYWDYYKKLLNLPDFSPESQDAVAIQQIKERGALLDIEDGRIKDAIDKVKNIWASLPGAGYGQREEDIGRLIVAYRDAGGSLA